MRLIGLLPPSAIVRIPLEEREQRNREPWVTVNFPATRSSLLWIGLLPSSAIVQISLEESETSDVSGAGRSSDPPRNPGTEAGTQAPTGESLRFGPATQLSTDQATDRARRGPRPAERPSSTASPLGSPVAGEEELTEDRWHPIVPEAATRVLDAYQERYGASPTYQRERAALDAFNAYLLCDAITPGHHLGNYVGVDLSNYLRTLERHRQTQVKEAIFLLNNMPRPEP